MSAAALAISLPGLSKAVRLGGAWPRVEIDLNQPPPRLSEFIFGLAPAPFGTEFEAALWFLAALASVIAIRRGQADPAFALLLRSLACSLAVVTLLHGVVRTGFAPRYLAVAWCATALIGVGLASSAPRWGVFLSVMVWTANLAAIHGYLKASPQARQDWREAMARFEKRLGSRGTLLSFPFHHGAVAAHAYAPGLEVGGGFTSRQAAVYWYDAPARFSGYGFEGLRRFETAEEALTRIASRLEVCLVSDEPDVTKTATVFGAFKRQGARPFDTGDPRLRALCR